MLLNDKNFSTVVFNTMYIKNDLSSFYKIPSTNGAKLLLSNKGVSLEESFRVYDAVKTNSMVDLKILVELIGKCRTNKEEKRVNELLEDF